MNKFISAVLISLLPAMAHADFSCKNTQDSIELTLVNYEADASETSLPAAAVLKNQKDLKFYKGDSSMKTVQQQELHDYKFMNDNGEDLDFTMVIAVKKNSGFGHCTRAACDPIPFNTTEITIPSILIDGTDYELTCKESLFL